MKASLKNYRQAPRKVRLIANHLRGKSVAAVIDELSFMPQKAAAPLKKLIESAVANARQTNSALSTAGLTVERITVDKGTTFTRYMPRAFGRAAPIHRESSHVQVQLGEQRTSSVEPVAKAIESPLKQKKVRASTKSKSQS